MERKYYCDRFFFGLVKATGEILQKRVFTFIVITPPYGGLQCIIL